LSAIKHSTLGQAEFNYDALERLSYLVLGNDAWTTYTYDQYGRLTAFDIKEADNDRILRHSWGYDALGRKSATADITVTSPYFSENLIDITYDAASRLTRETFKVSGGATNWDVQSRRFNGLTLLIGTRRRRRFPGPLIPRSALLR
jgi:hypothetical protein